MIRYRLDDLGWFQFEWLIQALLKTELGLGVEAWGGSSDYGRDAYYRGPLPFPSREQRAGGPFIFQVKFVEQANAAGADWKPALMKAVGVEARRISERLKFKTWKSPGYYVLVTNAPVTAAAREGIGASLTSALGDECPSYTLGGSDVCDLLDAHPTVRKSFPQLLGLRDLNELLASVVRADVITKSRFAIELARDLATVFVPTAAYERALRVLAKHNFVVLEGPPEMGKSAIAWIISLVQVSLGWQAIACDRPDELFANYDSNARQVFIADDAFGRTEYDVTRGSQWERQLERVLQLIDSKHWLVWTSRKHILERAKRELDLQGKASHFPDPAEVLVDASELTLREKALILYRHAKAITPTKAQADVVRSFAVSAIGNANFTPERIRRLVTDRMEEFVIKAGQTKGGLEAILSDVTEAIRNPTSRMRLSFQHLSLRHKWLLVCVLEGGAWPSIEDVHRLYEQTCPPEHLRPFVSTLEELSESFVSPRGHYLFWMHPSYRDLVIEELVEDASLREVFLRRMTVDGFKLALSEAGGATGERTFPFMVDPRSWELLQARLAEYVPTATVGEICEILEVLGAALEVTDETVAKPHLTTCLKSVCALAKQSWDGAETVLTAHQLQAYSSATVRLTPIPPLPLLDASWSAADCLLSGEQNPQYELNADNLEEWSKFIDAVASAEPRVLAAKKFPQDYAGQIDALLARVRDDVESDTDVDSPAEMRSEAARLVSLAETMVRFAKLGSSEAEHSIDLSNRLHAKAEALEDRANQEDDPEPDPDNEEHSGRGFDISGLFRDL
jgi:hypothetical protein